MERMTMETNPTSIPNAEQTKRYHPWGAKAATSCANTPENAPATPSAASGTPSLRESRGRTVTEPAAAAAIELADHKLKSFSVQLNLKRVYKY